MKQKYMFFLEFPWFLHDAMNVENFISGSSAFSKSILYILRFSIHVLLKPSLKDFEYKLASMWDECNYMVVWTFFGIALLLEWRGVPLGLEWKLIFSSPVATAESSNLLRYWMPHLTASSFRILKWSEVSQSCPTLGDPMDRSLPCSSVLGSFQARLLECVAISFSRGSSQPRIGKI